MNIIIPLGGVGKRFSDNGYTKPKPLIKVLGKEIIFWVLDSLNLSKNDKLFIPYNEFLDVYNFEEVVKSKFPNVKVKSIPTTNGPAETIKICIEHFNIKGKVIIMDGDNWYEEDILDPIRKVDKNLCVYFLSKTKDPVFSYIKIKNKKIIEIIEKVKISNNANTGCYVFNNSDELLRYINKLTFNKEMYISNIISDMIADNIHFSSIKVDKYHVLGTPQQIIEFAQSYKSEIKRFVFDLDNTLVTFPTIEGDYNSVLPIEKTIKYVQNLKKLGHYIIIYTARRMRTHNGNVDAVIKDIGKLTEKNLKKFNIPYDELIFGKPYAHFYIDDLMINPKTDLNKELGYYLENVEPRHFNKLIFEKDTVIKISDDSKLNGESYYYEEITNHSINYLFPKLISKSKGKIEIEKIEGTNFSTLFINQILTLENLESLFNEIKNLHDASSADYFKSYYDYTLKLDNRFENFNYENYGVSLPELNEVKNNIKGYEGVKKIIHGDLVFSNIILTKEGNIKLVDVKGKIGDEYTIYGDPLYDYAKIYQSLIGYDEILLDKNIDESYRKRLLTYFESLFLNEELVKIKNITKSLLYSLIPLHNDPKKFEKYINLARLIKY